MSDAKRRTIILAGTTLFLRDGYRATSVDQIAAAAAVSKQTVYKHFTDKEGLFRAIVLGVTANAEVIAAQLTADLRGSDITTPEDLRVVLTDLARNYIAGVLAPNVLALRRLVMAEAEAFPDLAATYFETGPTRAITLIAESFADLSAGGLLHAEDPQLAAAHFAYLVLGIPLDQAQFHPGQRPSPAQRERLASEAVRVFLAAYG